MQNPKERFFEIHTGAYCYTDMKYTSYKIAFAICALALNYLMNHTIMVQAWLVFSGFHPQPLKSEKVSYHLVVKFKQLFLLRYLTDPLSSKNNTTYQWIIVCVFSPRSAKVLLKANVSPP